MGVRNVVSAILERRADALLALAHRSIRQANRVKIFFVVGLAGADVHLDFNDVGIDTIDGRALGLEEHWAGESL